MGSEQAGIDLQRVITFELADREEMIILAGTGEFDQRIIKQTDELSGRFTVVAVDELLESGPVAGRSEIAEEVTPDVANMRVIGDSAVLPASESGEVGLMVNGDQWTNMSAAGVHAHLWYPLKEF